MDTNLRIRADALGHGRADLREPARRVRPARQRDRRARRRRRARSTPSSARAASRPREPAPAPEHVRAPARSHEPVAHGARPLRRDQARHHRAARAARGRHGRAPAQQGAALRARSAARRVDPARDARRQGGHGQDAARPRRGPEAHDGGRRVHAHARLPAGHAARARHRLSARRRRREAQPLDAADLRQPRVLFSDGLAQGTARVRRAARERADPGRAAHLHPRPVAPAAVHRSSTRRRTSRRTR